MGFFGGKSSASASPSSSAAAASTEQQDALKQEQQQQQQMEKEELDRLLGGAPDNADKIADMRRFIGSNTRHTYADGLLGVAAYTFSGLQHVHGQSTALTLLTMWAAGTTFLVSAATRKVLTEATRAGIRQDEGAAGPQAGEAANLIDSSATSAEDAKKQQQQRQQQQQFLSIATGAEFDLQRRNVFQLEAVGSWIWMMASLQQFRVHKRLKWCGYSSWTGLGCAAYYTLRHMYNVLVL